MSLSLCHGALCLQIICYFHLCKTPRNLTSTFIVKTWPVWTLPNQRFCFISSNYWLLLVRLMQYSGYTLSLLSFQRALHIYLQLRILAQSEKERETFPNTFNNQTKFQPEPEALRSKTIQTWSESPYLLFILGNLKGHTQKWKQASETNSLCSVKACVKPNCCYFHSLMAFVS